MCGITGLMTLGPGRTAAALRQTVQVMASRLLHRGPDDGGAWADEAAGLALGHRRLAIVDLSAAGHQPMASSSGRFVMAFNGEIYNHLELRQALERMDCRASLAMTGDGDGLPRFARNDDLGWARNDVLDWASNDDISGASNEGRWRGHSDTETLLAGFEAWGIEATLQKTVGMFAIALWDRKEQVLTLARDRMGEKPLYYGWVAGAFVFGSELKALRAYPGFDNPICRQALAQYMRFMYVPAPRSIYQGVFKLEPGCMLTVRGAPPPTAPAQALRPGQVHGSVAVRRWWSLGQAVKDSAQNPVASDAEAVKLLQEQLSLAVSQQSLADVPLGAFLSGGVDSSAIVALMQQQAREQERDPVKTFTIGFDEAGFDESPHARAVAQHLGTDHTEMRVSARMAQAVIPTLPHMYDEPFADSSQIPTHLVCRAARQHVTVALSGDAGDELFGGYNRYFWGPRIWNRLSWLPFAARQRLGKAIAAVPVGGWDAMSGLAGVSRLGDKAHKLAKRLGSVQGMDDLYWSLVSEWEDPGSLVVRGTGGTDGLPRFARNDGDGLLRFDRHGGDGLPRFDRHGGDGLNDPVDAVPSGLGDVERMMFLDSMSYLPDDILCKVDRAAMACSLETRVPFLDHRVVELAWRMPLHMKVRGNVGKWVLRQVLYQHVPRELIERPKAGFAVPVGQWLRGPLRDWAEDLLGEHRLQAEGYLHPGPIRAAWAEHLNGQRDHTAKLWAVLMFQAWLQGQGTAA